MNSREIELALKKQHLLLRSAALREEFAAHAAGLAPVLSVADRVRDGARWLGAHPQVVALAATLLVLLRPRSVWRWGRRGLLAWRMWRGARSFLQERLAAATLRFR